MTTAFKMILFLTILYLWELKSTFKRWLNLLPTGILKARLTQQTIHFIAAKLYRNCLQKGDSVSDS